MAFKPVVHHRKCKLSFDRFPLLEVMDGSMQPVSPSRHQPDAWPPSTWVSNHVDGEIVSEKLTLGKDERIDGYCHLMKRRGAWRTVFSCSSLRMAE